MFQSITNLAKDTKNEILNLINAFNGKPTKNLGEFAKRIRRRHRVFWKLPEDEAVRNTVMNADDSFEQWRGGKNWQRKLSNKNNAGEFAKKHGCRVPELYWCGRDTDKINFDNLPGKFVLKPTIGHSSKLVFLINNKINLMNNLSYSWEDLAGIMNEAFKQNSYLEFRAEEFIRSEKGDYKIPVDYKFHTFNGAIAAIGVINRFANKEGFMSVYDENWNPIAQTSTIFPKGDYQDPPGCFKEMIIQAKELSKAYEIYVRIDFYDSDQGPVFGEFTPTPSAGKYFTKEADRLFVKYWDKYCKGMI